MLKWSRFCARYKVYFYFYFCSLLITQDFLGTSLLNGFLFYYILKPIDYVQYDVGNIFALLMNISVVFFAMEFLKNKNKFNNIISRLFIVIQAILLTPILINIVIPIHIQNPTTSYLVNHSILFGFIWVFYLGIFNFSSSRGKIFILASTPKFLGQIVKTLLLQGSIAEHVYFLSIDMSFIFFNISAIGSLYEAVFIIFFLINSYIKNIENKNSELKATMLKLQQSEINAALIDLSRQVAHDIRSPLAVLTMMTGSLTDIPEDKRILIRNATQRINDIANGLLRMGKTTLMPDSVVVQPVVNMKSIEFIPALVDILVSEKRMQFREHGVLEIQTDLKNSFGSFSEINSTELKRVIITFDRTLECATQELNLKIMDKVIELAKTIDIN